jgi:hypothetical protein
VLRPIRLFGSAYALLRTGEIVTAHIEVQ